MTLLQHGDRCSFPEWGIQKLKSPLLSILLITVIVETYILLNNFSSSESLLGSSKIFSSRNVNTQEKLRKILRRFKDLEEELDELTTKNETSLLDDKTQPMRLEKLSDRPEVIERIKSQIDNRSVNANRWKLRFLPAEHPSFWKQHRFKTHGGYGFIQYSGYRAGPRTFVCNGLHLVPLENSRLLQSCLWYGRDDSFLNGSLRLLKENQTGTKEVYEVSVLMCDFPEDTGTAGGRVVAVVDYEEFVMFVEDPSKIHPLSVQVNQESQFKHEIVFCSTCVHDSVVSQHVWDFLEFYRVIHDIDHFFFYDGGGIDAALRSKMLPYQNAGLVTITDIREILLFSVLFWGQTLAVNDCLYRNRFSAKWIMTMDVDEYVQLKPGNTIKGFLSQNQYKDCSFLTHGTYFWSTQYCVKGNETGAASRAGRPFLVERMLFRPKGPYCIREGWKPDECWDALGHRKLIVNPRKVNITQVHNVKNHSGMRHLLVGEEVWHGHFPGLGSGYDEPKLCSKEIEVTEMGSVKDLEGFVVDDSIKKLIAIVKQCPLGTSKECGASLIKKSGN